MRQMYWADVVPLGTFATWACEPNPTIEEIKAAMAASLVSVETPTMALPTATSGGAVDGNRLASNACARP